ncbi:hypothetical protein [Wolbachia endosymbiont (group B) of Camptogramma bilineatum]|uniref:hypothetical protein n=1 Tax=Wolbachia endosymbiont (group B) of Camptogramma bilineatum TaxID=2953991 RepID=UPI002230E9D9|nr:hypothetical protein [Wolbachia endosymbiont (group B) of Camptogramma bilineatum]
MQGLVVCKLCNYAYYGTSTARNKEGKKLIIRYIIVVLVRIHTVLAVIKCVTTN